MMDEAIQTAARTKPPAIKAAVGKAVAISKGKVAVVVPIAPKAADVAFPGGVVGPAGEGRVSITIDPGTGGRTLAGSDHQPFTETLLDAVLATIRTSTNDPKAATNRIAAAAAALAAFRATDEVEAMLAAQAVAMHSMGLECFRRAMLPDQPPDVASKLRRDGANLCRGMSDMLDSLDRRRGKSPQVQVMRIERVLVDGNAVIGHVHPVAAPKVGEGGV